MRWPLSRHVALPALPKADHLVFAIGDIHGRRDLMLAMLDRILADVAVTPPSATPLIVFLGDYVDRGPESRGVIDILIELDDADDVAAVALKGNHEAALLTFLDDPAFGPTWLNFGGAETLASYGVGAPKADAELADWERTSTDFAARLPDRHLRFLRSLPSVHVVDDYAFVHAGVRPGVALDAQEEEDLLWIREPFLSSRASCGKVIVHGHTPTEQPFDGRFRIGVDTGAYATSVLTAVRLEGTTRAFIQVSPPLTVTNDRISALNPPVVGRAS